MAKKEPDNTLLYVALGLAAVGGAYFYFKNPDDDQDLKAKATREAGQRKQKGSESVDAVKTRADKILRYGEAKYDQVTVFYSSGRHRNTHIICRPWARKN